MPHRCVSVFDRFAEVEERGMYGLSDRRVRCADPSTRYVSDNTLKSRRNEYKYSPFGLIIVMREIFDQAQETVSIGFDHGPVVIFVVLMTACCKVDSL